MTHHSAYDRCAGCQLYPLRWRHNGRDSVSNHQPHDCLLNHLFRRRSKKTSELHVIGLCAGNSPWTGEFSAQMASNAENVTIWWRHHDHKLNGTLFRWLNSLSFRVIWALVFKQCYIETAAKLIDWTHICFVRYHDTAHANIICIIWCSFQGKIEIMIWV